MLDTLWSSYYITLTWKVSFNSYLFLRPGKVDRWNERKFWTQVWTTQLLHFPSLNIPATLPTFLNGEGHQDRARILCFTPVLSVLQLCSSSDIWNAEVPTNKPHNKSSHQQSIFKEAQILILTCSTLGKYCSPLEKFCTKLSKPQAERNWKDVAHIINV